VATGGSTVRVTFLGDADSLARAATLAQGQIDKVGKSVSKGAKIGSFFGSMAGGLATNALGKMQSFAAGSVDAFARIEDATGAAGVQFGAQLPIITKFADEAAKNFGISKGAALDAANTFGTLGKAAGLSGTDLSGFATDLSGLAGDLASFKGTSTEQAIDAIGAALRGESEPVRAYGVMLDEATLKAEAMSMGLLKATKDTDAIKAAQMRAQLAQKAYNKAVGEHGANSDEAKRAQLSLTTAQNGLKKATEGTVGPLTTSQKILAAQSAITKQTTDAQGDFTRTASSTANVQKTLAAETENAQAKLGQQLAPALTAVRTLMLQGIKAVSSLASGISVLSGFVADNKTAFAAFAAVVTALVLPAMINMVRQWVISATTATASAAKQAAAWLMTQTSAYRSVAAHAVAFAAMIAGWIRAGAQATASAVKMAAAWLIAIGPIAIAIAAVVGAVYLIVKNWDKIKAATVKAWNAVKAAVQKAIGFVVTILTNFTGPGLIIKHFDKIVATIKGLPGKAKQFVGEFVQAGVDLVMGFIKGIQDKAKELPGIVGNAIVSPVKNAISGVKGFFSRSPSRWARDEGRNVGDGLGLGLTDSQKKLQARAQKVVDRLKEKLAQVKEFAKDIRAAFTSMADVTGIDTMVTDAAGEQREGGFPAMIAALRKRADDAKKFVAAMAQLRRQGLNETSLQQIRDAGPEGGLSAAQNLLGGGLGGIAEVNRLMAEINRVGAGFAAGEARRQFGIGPDATLSARDVKVIIDPRGGEDDFKKWLRKWVRAEGGNVQKVLGGR
jgi:hypothetical protein